MYFNPRFWILKHFEMVLGRNLIFQPRTVHRRRFCSTLATNSKKWKGVVGLEVHAQIQSESKLFSGASTKFSNPVNTNAALFDVSTPGTLPVLNKFCVEAGVLTALSLNCTVNPVSYFDRKHYFYADMPCGYQITQQRAPLASNGSLDFQVFTPGIHKKPYKSRARIKQLQLEQDSGKSLHDSDRSLVDLNRAGAPLMELVFEPDLVDGEEAAALIKELMLIFQRIQTCSCKMEEGALRIDANVSVHREGEPLGIRTEIKNIGSIRGVAGAIRYEIERQIGVREANGTIINETRSWNAEEKVTVSMRDKEVQQDYRYMPEPNLPPLHIAMGPVENGYVNADAIKKKIPELPEQTRHRLREDLGLTAEQSIILVNDVDLLRIFEGAIFGRSIRCTQLANFLKNDLNKALNEMKLEIQDLNIDPNYFGEIMELSENGTISRGTAILVLDELLKGNVNSPSRIIEQKRWKQISDENELLRICQEVFDENEKAVRDYLSGKSKAFNALMKAVVEKTESRADMKKCVIVAKEVLSNRMKK